VDTTTVIRGFTIQNGYYGNDGGGIGCYYSASPTIIANIIKNNESFFFYGSGGNGGGISCNYSSPSIVDNVITENTADLDDGGAGVGIFCGDGSPVITGNLIMNNAGSEGGGIFCWGPSCSSIITECTITNNIGEGIRTQFSTPTIQYCSITNNEGYAVLNQSANVLVNAENNWWGHANGPYHPTANPSGLGDTVSDYVDFSPWLTNPGINEYTISVPLTLYLQVTPNPFTNETQIRYMIHDPRYTMEELRSSNLEMRKPTLEIYDAAGRLVRDFFLPTTYYLLPTTVSWDGRDGQNRILVSGTYFVVLQAGERGAAKKILLVR
jgi:hypothetical protein